MFENIVTLYETWISSRYRDILALNSIFDVTKWNIICVQPILKRLVKFIFGRRIELLELTETSGLGANLAFFKEAGVDVMVFHLNEMTGVIAENLRRHLRQYNGLLFEISTS